MIVADIIGVTPDDVNVRAGHDSYWNSHAGFSGTYASQFAVTGLGAVKAADKLAVEIKRLGSVVLGCDVDDLELAEGHVRMKANPGRPAADGVRRDHQREQRGPAGGSRCDPERAPTSTGRRFSCRTWSASTAT